MNIQSREIETKINKPKQIRRYCSTLECESKQKKIQIGPNKKSDHNIDQQHRKGTLRTNK